MTNSLVQTPSWQYTIIPVPSWRLIWKILPTIRKNLEGKKTTLWHRLLLGNIMTNSRLHHINPTAVPHNLCRLCHQAPETINHLFSLCTCIKQASHTILQPITPFLHHSTSSPFEILFPFAAFQHKHSSILTIYYGCLIWAIWRTLWTTPEPPHAQHIKILRFFHADWKMSSPLALTRMPPELRQPWALLHIPDP